MGLHLVPVAIRAAVLSGHPAHPQSRRLTGERGGADRGPALVRVASGLGTAATTAGSAAKLGLTGRTSRTDDVTAGGKDRN
jgi:hypothetical protein